jgi:LacI family transcriptional regulator
MRRRTTRNGRFSTMADVARQAGVSTASVSRVLNDPAQVSPKLRQRVENAVAKLHYVRDGAARALAARRSSTIGAVVPALGAAIFAAGVEGLQRRLDQLGHSLLVASSNFDLDVELRQARTLLERGVDGIVLVGHRHRRELFNLLAQTRTPYVFTYTYAGGRHPCVGFDQGAAMRGPVDLLAGLGHRRFAIVTTPTRENDRIAARVAGAQARILALDLPEPPIFEMPFAFAAGRDALRALLRDAPSTTAVLCTTDVHATGVLAEARRLAIDVPDRLSVTGFDDLEMSAEMEPPLTTIRVPAREIGERAADLLIARVQGRAAVPHVALDVAFTVRGSTGRAPKT